MRRLGLISAVVGLLLAVCVPARAESARRTPDPEAKAKARAAAQKDCAASRTATATEARPAVTGPSDTIVVPAGPDHPGFTMVGENVTYADPSFVPYKLRESARRARANADLSKIP
jgi:hypothetical protein